MSANEWMYEDELPEDYPYDEMFPYSKVDGVRMFPKVENGKPANGVIAQSAQGGLMPYEQWRESNGGDRQMWARQMLAVLAESYRELRLDDRLKIRMGLRDCGGAL